jgi:hypothetical protein
VHERGLPTDEAAPWAARPRLEKHCAKASVPWAYRKRPLGRTERRPLPLTGSVYWAYQGLGRFPRLQLGSR